MFHNRKYRQTPSILLLLCTVTSYPSFLCVYLEIIFEWPLMPYLKTERDSFQDWFYYT